MLVVEVVDVVLTRGGKWVGRKKVGLMKCIHEWMCACQWVGG